MNKAIALAPQYAKAHYNRSLVWLSQGRLAEGWSEYEWRLQCPDVNPRRFAEPQWNGEPLSDRRLLVHAEQGLGDTFQFVRYLPLVQDAAATSRSRCRRHSCRSSLPRAFKTWFRQALRIHRRTYSLL